MAGRQHQQRWRCRDGEDVPREAEGIRVRVCTENRVILQRWLPTWSVMVTGGTGTLQRASRGFHFINTNLKADRSFSLKCEQGEWYKLLKRPLNSIPKTV